jgi:hypothetical protein
MLNAMDALLLTIGLCVHVGMHGYVLSVLKAPAVKREMERCYDRG